MFSSGSRSLSRRNILTCFVLALVGFNLRSVILAVPPLLPLIQRDLQLSYAVTGMLTSLPTLVICGMAWFSGALVERLGGRLCVFIGLLLLSVGAILRGVLPGVVSLFVCTALLSAGIAMAQTAVPALVRTWFPTQIGLVSALFSDGMIIGEAVAAGVTVPVMALFLGQGNWAATCILWGLPVLLILGVWFWLTPSVPVSSRTATRRSGGPTRAKQPRVKGEQARVSALHLGVLLGGGSLIYFGMNGWIASYNQAIQHSEMTSLALAVLNISQLPASLVLTIFAQRIMGQRRPFIIVGFVCAISIIGWIFSPAALEPLWAALLGAGSAIVFTLGIALPSLLAEPEDVARLTGTTVSITYGVAFIGPFIGGALWDFFHFPPVAFFPVVLGSLLLIVLGALLPTRMSFARVVPLEEVERVEEYSSVGR